MQTRSIVLVSAFFFSIVPTALPAAALDPDYYRKVVDYSKKIHERITDTPGLVKFLDDLDKGLSRDAATISSLVDERDIESVLQQTEDLNELYPPALEPLNTKQRIEEIAGVTDGSVIGGAEQLDRLQKAGEERKLALKELESAKADAEKLAKAYDQTASTAQAISDKIGGLVGDPVIEILVLAGGKNFGLSWLDLETALVPALVARADAAMRNVKRLDEATKLAAEDLKNFEEARKFADRLFDPTAVSVEGKVLEKIKTEMDEGTKRAVAQANAWREDARKIDEHNAGIQKIQNFLNFVGSAASLASAAKGNSGGGASTSAPATDTKTIIIFDSVTGNYALKKTVTTQKKKP